MALLLLLHAANALPRNALGVGLSAVHVHHGLRGDEADADLAFVQELCRRLEVPLQVQHAGVAERVTKSREAGAAETIEEAARELRYECFARLIAQGHADSVLTAHTLDDQAETVLMRLTRGAGLRGLGGIHPRIVVEDDDGEAIGEIVRPLLAFRRHELEAYLSEIGQSWREDTTNSDEKFTRNRVRKLVLPLLEKEFNPAVAENLAELAEIARGEEDYWENEVAGWMGTGVHWPEPEWARRKPLAQGLVQIGPTAEGPAGITEPAIDDLQSRIAAASWLVMNASVDRMWFLGEPAAVQRRLIKAIGENAGLPLEFKHVEEILRFAGESGGSGKELSLPLGWKLMRKPDELVFVTPDLREPNRSEDYDYDLPIPGRVELPELGVTIEARCVRTEQGAGYNPEQLLDTDSLPGPLRVRNWRAGDRFWPSHTKSPKKIKELLQERHVAQPERKLWPVVTSGNEIVWLRGFPVAAQFRAKPGCESILIMEALPADETQI